MSREIHQLRLAVANDDGWIRARWECFLRYFWRVQYYRDDADAPGTRDGQWTPQNPRHLGTEWQLSKPHPEAVGTSLALMLDPKIGHRALWQERRIDTV